MQDGASCGLREPGQRFSSPFLPPQATVPCSGGRLRARSGAIPLGHGHTGAAHERPPGSRAAARRAGVRAAQASAGRPGGADVPAGGAEAAAAAAGGRRRSQDPGGGDGADKM